MISKVELLLNSCGDFDSLMSQLNDSNLSIEDLSDFVSFSEERYTRNTIYSTDIFDLLLLCWMPGQETDIHNHGNSSCVFKVMNGELTESLYMKAANKLVLTRKRDMSLGQQGIVSGKGNYHKISNNTAHQVISLHLYSPPLKEIEHIVINENNDIDISEVRYEY